MSQENNFEFTTREGVLGHSENRPTNADETLKKQMEKDFELSKKLLADTRQKKLENSDEEIPPTFKFPASEKPDQRKIG